MNTKTIAIIALFTAISVVLVLSPAKIPAPFAPFLKYQIWEIPIVAAFLLYSPLVGLTITILNTLILIVIYPGDLPTGPLYNLAAILSTLLGIYIIQRLTKIIRLHYLLVVILSTSLGAILRVGVMTVVNYVFLQYPYPIGYNMPTEFIVPLLPLIALFNATLVIYTVPLGYVITKAVEHSIILGNVTEKSTPP